MTYSEILERLNDIDSEKAQWYAELSRINREEAMLMKLLNETSPPREEEIDEWKEFEAKDLE